MLIHSAIGVTAYDGIEQGDITLGELIIEYYMNISESHRMNELWCVHMFIY